MGSLQDGKLGASNDRPEKLESERRGRETEYRLRGDSEHSEHSGNKYHRRIHGVVSPAPAPAPSVQHPITVDIYNVLDAFQVTCPAVAHAVKKLLCAGIRGKGDVDQDLREARDAVTRAITLNEQRAIHQPPPPPSPESR